MNLIEAQSTRLAATGQPVGTVERDAVSSLALPLGAINPHPGGRLSGLDKTNPRGGSNHGGSFTPTVGGKEARSLAHGGKPVCRRESYLAGVTCCLVTPVRKATSGTART